MLQARIDRFAGPRTPDLEARLLLARLADGRTFTELPPDAARRAYRDARLPLTGWAAPAELLDITPEFAPRLRLYRPIATANAAAYRRGHAKAGLIYLHGGGWSVGDLDTYDPLCRRLASALGAAIIWVEYRLAPEHPYPDPLDDTLAACRWIFDHADFLGVDARRLAIGGDSAGANLAAVTALMNHRGELGQRFAGLLLAYPCLDLTASLASHRKFASGYLLTAETYAWYRANYLGDADPSDWRLSPLFAPSLGELPPTVLLRAGFDPLHDEAVAFAMRLRDAAVPHREIAFPGMIHGFLNMAGVLPQAEQAIRQIAQDAHEIFTGRPTAAAQLLCTSGSRPI